MKLQSYLFVIIIIYVVKKRVTNLFWNFNLFME